MRIAFLAATIAAAGLAYGNAAEPIVGFAGSRVATNLNGSPIGSTSAGETDVIIYDATTGSANAAFSSTDLNSTFGDRVTTTGTGKLKSLGFGIFNSGSGGAALQAARVTFTLSSGDGVTPLGSFFVDIAAGAGLPDEGLGLGFFTTINAPGLETLNIELNTTDLLIRQQTSNVSGSSRIGVVSIAPPSVGSSIPQMFIQSGTVNAGTPGFYNITSGGAPITFDTAYRVIVPEPASFALLAGLLPLALRRRRA